MKKVSDKILDLKQRKHLIMQMGGKKAVDAHKAKGKFTARERLDLFFDRNTFREVDMFATHRCTNYGMEDVEIASDGVVCGYGLVDGRPVYA